MRRKWLLYGGIVGVLVTLDGVYWWKAPHEVWMGVALLVAWAGTWMYVLGPSGLRKALMPVCAWCTKGGWTRMNWKGWYAGDPVYQCERCSSYTRRAKWGEVSSVQGYSSTR